jgi:hypothetical protein
MVLVVGRADDGVRRCVRCCDRRRAGLIVLMRSGVVPHQRTPEEVLHERFARGEIDSTDYHEKLDALQEQRYTRNH